MQIGVIIKEEVKDPIKTWELWEDRSECQLHGVGLRLLIRQQIPSNLLSLGEGNLSVDKLFNEQSRSK